MPRIGSLTDAQVESHLRDLCPPKTLWRRSARGNLWRKCKGARLVVYERGRGSYLWGWLISQGTETVYGPCSYRSEEDAVAAVLDVAEAL